MSAAAGSKVVVKGRLGEVMVHDPEDDDLAYKIKFEDGFVDWFGARDVVASEEADHAEAQKAKAPESSWKLAREGSACFCFAGAVTLKHQRPRCKILDAAKKVPTVLLVAPHWGLARQSQLFLNRLGTRRCITLLQGIDATVLALVLRDLPPSKSDDLVTLAEGLPVEKLHNLLNGEIQVGSLVSCVEHVQPASLVRLVAGVPGSIVRAVLSEVPTPTLIELVNTVESMALVEIVAGAPPDRIIGLLQQVASGSLEMTDLVKIIRGLPARVVRDLFQNIPSSCIAELVRGIDGASLLFILGKVAPSVISILVTHVEARSLIELLNKVDPSQTVEFCNTMEPTAIVELLRGAPLDAVIKLFHTAGAQLVCFLLIEISITKAIDLMNMVSTPDLLKLVRGVEPNTLANTAKHLQSKYIAQLVGGIEGPALVFLLSSVDPSALATLLTQVKSDIVIELVCQIELRNIVQLLNSDVETMAIVELVSKAPLDVVLHVLKVADIEKLIVILREVPPDQLVKLLKKVSQKDLASLIAVVDSRVLANIAGSTSSSFLKHVISVVHGRCAGKILRVAPQTMSSVLPTLMPVSSAKRLKAKPVSSVKCHHASVSCQPRADAKVSESIE